MQVPISDGAVSCAYCASSFVPSVHFETNRRSTVATERTAAELALRRLHFERRDVQRDITNYESEARMEAERVNYLHRMEIEKRQTARSLRIDEVKELRKAMLSLVFLCFVLAFITEWRPLWFGFLGGLFFVVTAQIALFFMPKVVGSESLPILQRKQTDEELHLISKLSRIEAEIARHRQTIGAEPSR